MKVHYLLKQYRFHESVNVMIGKTLGESQAIITLWTIEIHSSKNRGTVLAETAGCYLRR